MQSLPTLRVGDLVFIRARSKPFREVAAATGSWTNHVGVVVCAQGGAARRTRVPYDTGFDADSRRQFCSKYAQEVVQEATGIALAPRQSFRTLLQRQPDADLRFWRLWFFGRIPWNRRTITPAALLTSPALRIVFDGRAD